MRYRAARTNITLDQEFESTGPEPYFFLRTDTHLGILRHLKAFALLLRTLVTVSVMLLILIVVPPSGTSLLLFYGPGVLCFGIPLLCRLRPSGDLIWWSLVVYLFTIVNYFQLGLDWASAQKILLPFVFWGVIYGFFVAMGVFYCCLYAGIAKGFFGFSCFLSMTLCAVALCFYPSDPDVVVGIVAVTAYAAVLGFGLTLLRGYAGWLSCSPGVPYESAVALARIARMPVSEIPDYFPKATVLSTSLMALGPLFLYFDRRQWGTAGIVEWIFRFLQSEFPEWNNTRQGLMTLCAALTIWMILSYLITFAVVRDGPWGGCELGSLWKAIVVWETDEHPMPRAPGVHSAARIDVFGLAIRRWITNLVVLSGALWLSICRVFWPVEFIDSQIDGPEIQAVEVSLLRAGIGALCAVSAVTFILGPPFVYITALAKGRAVPIVPQEATDVPER